MRSARRLTGALLLIGAALPAGAASRVYVYMSPGFQSGETRPLSLAVLPPRTDLLRRGAVADDSMLIEGRTLSGEAARAVRGALAKKEYSVKVVPIEEVEADLGLLEMVRRVWAVRGPEASEEEGDDSEQPGRLCERLAVDGLLLARASGAGSTAWRFLRNGMVTAMGGEEPEEPGDEPFLSLEVTVVECGGGQAEAWFSSRRRASVGRMVRRPRSEMHRLALEALGEYPAAGGLRAARTPGCAGADLVVTGAHVVTMDLRGRVAEAIAARDGRIVAVGASREIASCAGPGARTLDLQGATVIPGLIDVHAHALGWTKEILRGEIDAGYPAIRSIEEISGKVRERATASPAGEWIRGSGWDDAKLAERRYLARRDLDPVAPRNPVWLVHVSGHLGTANGAALKLAGITRATEDPAGGVIERDAAGEPTGVLKDRAMELVARLLPPDPPDLPARAAKLASEKALEVGLTTIHDVGVDANDRRGYQDAYRRGWLKLRVQMVPVVGSVADAEALVRLGVATGFGDEHLKLGAAKMFADGGMGARTVAIYPPSVDGEPGNFGLLIWKTEDMQKVHKLLAAAGWQLTTHAIGDRAIDQVLDSYAAAMKALGLKDPRFRIVHCGISTPAVQKRLKELGVLVDGNPPFVYWIGAWFRKYGPERVRWSYPGRSYIENGIVAGGGSDVSVTPLSPWWGIWAAVERRELASGEVLAPEERLTAPEALTLYTRNGATIGFEESEKGSLEPGKLADFVVVDRDVLGVPAEELKDVRVLRTFVGGEEVYSAGPRRPPGP